MAKQPPKKGETQAGAAKDSNRPITNLLKCCRAAAGTQANGEAEAAASVRAEAEAAKPPVMGVEGARCAARRCKSCGAPVNSAKQIHGC